jgi:hypothetical protein
MRLARVIRAHPDAASLLALIILPFLVFGRALLPGRVLSSADVLFSTYPWRGLAPGLKPGNDLLTDPAHLFQPWLIYAASEVWQGRLPLWNPQVFAGSPFFANPQSALLFPLNWVALIVPVTSAFALIAILKVSAIGLATYWFLRVRALHPLAALMGAISFMWSGLVIVWLQWSYTAVLIFVPMLFASVECLRIRPGRRPIALIALTVALGVWAGYPQSLALALAAASAWALWRARGAGVPFLTRYASGVALGLVLAAVQLLPFIEYARLSAVLATREAWMPPMSASFRSAINLLVPYYYGSPTGGDYWGEWNFNETAVSVGLAPWLLLPLALIARRPGTLFFGLMAVVAGLKLYGVGPELADAGSLVISFRIAPLVVFSLCVLGAIGMDTLLAAPDRSSPRQRTVVTIAFVAVVAVVFFSFTADYATMRRLGLAAVSPARYLWFLALFTTSAALCLVGAARRGAAWALALVGVQLVGLAPLAWSYNQVIDARLLYPAPPALIRLQQEVAQAPGRVLMAPNLAMLYGLEGVAAYDGMTPRHLDEAIRPEASALNLLGSGYVGEILVFLSPVRDLLGVRHVLVPPDVALDGAGLSLRYHGVDGRIYRNEAALPRAFVAAEARCLDTAQALTRIRARAVDFRREVLLTDCADATPGDARAPVRDVQSPGTARIERYGSDRVMISAESDRGGYLVLTDAWFPGWTASVDGQETRVERADHAFRAVKLGPGRHEVEFRYAPMSVRLGLALSVLAAVVAGVLAWPGRARRPLTLAVLAVCVAAWPVIAPVEVEASLPSPPFAVSIDVSPEGADNHVTVRVEAGPAPLKTAAPEAFDLYVVQLQGFQAMVFLTTAGAWSPTPVSVQRGLSASGFAPIAVGWPERRFGSMHVMVIGARTATDPLVRSNWLFRPILRNVTLRARQADDPRPSEALLVTGLLGGLSAVAVAIVLWLSRSRRPDDDVQSDPATIGEECEASAQGGADF